MSYILLLTVTYFFLVLSCLLSNPSNLSDGFYSYGYVVLAVFSLASIWKIGKRKVSMFFLFMLTVNLFLGGRFWAYLFDSSLDVFETTFFYSYTIDGKSRASDMIFLYSFIFFSTIGYKLGIKRNAKVRLEPKVSRAVERNIGRLLEIIFPIVLILVVYSSIGSVIENFKSGSYGFGDYNSDAVGGGYLRKFAQMSLSIFLSLSVVYCEKKWRNRYLMLYTFMSVCIVLGGSRASLGTLIFFLLWVYSIDHKVSLKKIALYGSIGLVLFFVAFSFSVRAAQSGFSLDSNKLALGLLYEQGGSIAVFDLSTRVKDYPVLPYFQTIIVGSSLIYRLFTGAVLYPKDISFSGHMCYSINPDRYMSGAGLGWTIMSDIYLFSGRNVFFFCLLSLLLAYSMAILDTWRRKSKFFLYVASAMLPGILMMPRGTLSAYFPMIFYVYIYFFIFVIISKRFKIKI